ncbi:helix-turn-helix domain-containing protein [Saccharopolyspora sp. CA-218241]|uniref:helix-turn-helix domain-containing protein n=1 Tax=Saccharopolyspora sp. CA-218241 TaxID=3240027 RepID=UPI003D965E54
MSETPRARALAKELRAARQATGMTMRQLGDALGWSEAKISRLETAQRGIKEASVVAILDALEIEGEARNRLLKMAREIDQPAWWELGQDLHHQTIAFIDAEQRAVRITEVALSLIPGLLQTRAYSRAVMESAGVDQDEASDLVSIRQVRQGVLGKREPAHLRCFIDEAALFRPVGGHRVMAEQLRALISASADAQISVRVIPLARGAHAGLGGTFVLFEFVKARPVAYVEARSSGAFLDQEEDVALFFDAVERIVDVSAPEAESVALLERYAELHEREAG